MPKTNISGKQILDGSVDLTVDVTGILPLANGGTGQAAAVVAAGATQAAARSAIGAGTSNLAIGTTAGTAKDGAYQPERTWAPEAVICQGALATGYNDLPGGIAVEPGPNANGISLDSVWIRQGIYNATFAAQSIFDVYVGTATSIGTLAVSVTLAAAANNQIATLGTSLSMAANAVVRVNCSTAGAGVTGPIHCQLRGRYVG